MHPALMKSAVAAIAGASLMCGPATAATAATDVARNVAPAAAPWVTDGGVVSHLPLRIRYGPTTADWIEGSFRPGTHLRVSCKVRGEYVWGNRLWYLLGDGQGYVSARYVRNYHYVPWCR
ncbi:SH3 domain-containing protein [Streptomyces humicola]|nr:SH3 domain-containing protein [Streptomyces humicola]